MICNLCRYVISIAILRRERKMNPPLNSGTSCCYYKTSCMSVSNSTTDDEFIKVCQICETACCSEGDNKNNEMYWTENYHICLNIAAVCFLIQFCEWIKVVALISKAFFGGGSFKKTFFCAVKRWQDITPLPPTTLSWTQIYQKYMGYK